MTETPLNQVDAPDTPDGKGGDGDPKPVGWATFLKGYSPGAYSLVTNLYPSHPIPTTPKLLHYPTLRLWCSQCEGERNFNIENDLPKPSSGTRRTEEAQQYQITDDWQYTALVYICRDCTIYKKIYSVALRSDTRTSNGLGAAIKIGEYPLEDEPFPTRLWKLVGPARELMIKGRRCERQGLGIAAFSYYRRIVEDNKTRILDQYIDAAMKLEATADVIRQLHNAKDEQQFRKVIESVTPALPQSLIFDGSNPLLLLHQITSVGLHGLSDSECLTYAHDVRTLLAELARRIDDALQDRQEVHAAVMRLVKGVEKETAKKSAP
jgi:hypothetical protein